MTRQKFKLSRDDPDMLTNPEFTFARENFPDWWAKFERLDLSLASDYQLSKMIIQAPTGFMAGYVYAWRVARIHLTRLAAQR